MSFLRIVHPVRALGGTVVHENRIITSVPGSGVITVVHGSVVGDVTSTGEKHREGVRRTPGVPWEGLGCLLGQDQAQAEGSHGHCYFDHVEC